jgi:hypothetical protein
MTDLKRILKTNEADVAKLLAPHLGVTVAAVVDAVRRATAEPPTSQANDEPVK